MNQQRLLPVERLRALRTLETQNTFVLLANVSAQVPLVSIRGRTLLAFERLIAQMKLNVRIEQSLLRECDRTQVTLERAILGMNGEMSLEQALGAESATAIFALELLLCVVQSNVGIKRTLDGEPSVALGTLVRFLSPVRVLVVPQETFLLERLSTQTANKLLSSEHTILMHLHGLASLEASIANITLNLQVPVVRLAFLQMNIVSVGFQCFLAFKLLLASAANVRFLAQFLHPLDDQLFLVVRFQMFLHHVMVRKLFVTLWARM